MRRLLVCFDSIEFHNAREKNCLEKLTNSVEKFNLDGHITVILPLINVELMKHDLHQLFLFEGEIIDMIIEHSLTFFDNLGRLSDPIKHIPKAIKKYNLDSKNIIIVDKWQARLDKAQQLGYSTVKVPDKGSPVYSKYIEKLEDLVKIISKF